LVYLLSRLITNSPLEIETNSYFLRLLGPEAWCVFLDVGVMGHLELK
jgi:hypothetical protein